MTETAREAPETAAFPDLEAFEPPEFLMARLNSQIRVLMNAALRGHGLKLVEWRVLQCLCEKNGPLTVAELAALAVIDRTVASRLVDRMAARGLVGKEALEQDRRFMCVTLSDKGAALYESSLAATRAARAQLFGGLADRDVSDLLRILSTMQINAERPLGRPGPAFAVSAV